jgi:glycosyltransferase involved in cell wall biosynthesis
MIRGGLETTAVCLARILAERGYRVSMIASRWPSRNLPADLSRVPVKWIRVLCPPNDLRIWRRLSRPAWGHIATSIGFEYQCGFHRGVQQIMHEADVTMTFLPRETAFVSAWRAARHRVNISYFPGGDVNWLKRDRSTVKLVNPSVARRKAEELAGLPIDGVLLPGVPDSCFASGRDQLAREAPFRLLFVGRLEPNKGVSNLLPILHVVVGAHPDIALRIVGDGPLRKDLTEEARRAGLWSRVDFAGAVSHDEVFKAMRSAGLLLFPSSHENFPLTLLEAQACGLPFIASDLEGIRGYVQPESCLLPPSDTAAWIRTIAALIDDYPVRARISAAGREWARKYSWSSATDQIESYIELALSRCVKSRSEVAPLAR